MSTWHVYLYGIMWDAGDAEDDQDVSGNPENLRVTVRHVETREEAIEQALIDAADEYGAMIQETEQIRTTRVD